MVAGTCIQLLQMGPMGSQMQWSRMRAREAAAHGSAGSLLHVCRAEQFRRETLQMPCAGWRAASFTALMLCGHALAAPHHVQPVLRIRGGGACVQGLRLAGGHGFADDYEGGAVDVAEVAKTVAADKTAGSADAAAAGAAPAGQNLSGDEYRKKHQITSLLFYR